MTPGSLFEKTVISLPQGCPMININAFWPVVHEKDIFLRFNKSFLILPQKGPAPLFEHMSGS